MGEKYARFLGAVAVVATMGACRDDILPDVPIDDGIDAETGRLMCTPAGATEGWAFTRLGAGAKPALTVAADGTVHAAFIHESLDGWVRYARLGAGGVDPLETLERGYFYGPIDIALESGQPSILFHDHGREDQVLGARAGADSWSIHPMSNQGHDGWYNAGTFAPDGTLHTASYDPSGFSGLGVIYGAWDGSEWTIEVAASGSFDYAGGMSIVRAVDGTVHIAYFDDLAGEAKLATRSTGGSWSVSTIDAPNGDRDVGRFPDIALDPDGQTLHVVYLVREASTTGTIRYARGAPGSFEYRDVAPASGFSIGFSGARDLATLDLDASGRPVVALQTSTELSLLRLTDDDVESLASFTSADGIRFNQQTEVEVDTGGRTHVVWWQTGGVPGTVCHAVAG